MVHDLACDVVVVGGGPAGSAVAAALAPHAKVLLLEKNEVSRKLCAGGILARARQHLPDHVAIPWQDDGIRHYILSCNYADAFRRSTRRALMGTVVRQEFDAALLKGAEQAGAKVLLGQPVSHVQVDDTGVAVQTPQLQVRARVLVGADGCNSIVGRQCGLVRRLECEAAVAMRVQPAAAGALRHCIAMDWGAPPWGYSWVFPKRDHLSVGAVAPGVGRETLLACARAHLRHCAGEGHQVLSIHTSWMPRSTSQLERAGSRVLLVGDAAALVDPFSREGITWALWSGELAAEAVKQFLAAGRPLTHYEELLRRSLLPELESAAAVAEWVYSDPRRAHYWLRNSRVVWESFCYVFSGRASYTVLQRVLGRVSGRRARADAGRPAANRSQGG